jgi:hypothetical protein
VEVVEQQVLAQQDQDQLVTDLEDQEDQEQQIQFQEVQ